MLKRRRTHLQQKIYRPEATQRHEDIHDRFSDIGELTPAHSPVSSIASQPSRAMTVTPPSIHSDQGESPALPSDSVSPDRDTEWLLKETIKRRRAPKKGGYSLPAKKTIEHLQKILKNAFNAGLESIDEDATPQQKLNARAALLAQVKSMDKELKRTRIPIIQNQELLSPHHDLTKDIKVMEEQLHRELDNQSVMIVDARSIKDDFEREQQAFDHLQQEILEMKKNMEEARSLVQRTTAVSLNASRPAGYAQDFMKYKSSDYSYSRHEQ
ncbi:hypothetical protein BCR43DRAFT_483297 [Syncephalastrum racemosum]|uniref:Uncharacterized protein n=1 Tax=Syncephalastrum racemosum TaxID=13706 RepID=A0A1X2HV29_SYNRA|nr:hypothetical protein BCR43DRAFT_483297 [Syncephalastrum racemosum]